MVKRKRKTGEPSIPKQSVKYCDIPSEQKKKWTITNDPSILVNYTKLLDWMHDWVTKDFEPMGGISRLGCKKGCSLIQVQIVHENTKCKFLFSRNSLYLLAFYCSENGWEVFKDDEMSIDFSGIDEPVKHLERSSRYQSEPWKKLGPGQILKALEDICEVSDSPDDDSSLACEVIAVHLSEACRFRYIRSIICNCLVASQSDSVDDWGVIGKEGEEGKIVNDDADCVDIISCMKALKVDLNKCIDGGDHIKGFIHGFKDLTVAWMGYVLTQERVFSLNATTAKDCGIRSIKSLRLSLSLLGNCNVEKIVENMRGRLKKGTAPPNFTEDVLKIMESEFDKINGEGA